MKLGMLDKIQANSKMIDKIKTNPVDNEQSKTLIPGPNIHTDEYL